MQGSMLKTKGKEVRFLTSIMLGGLSPFFHCWEEMSRSGGQIFYSLISTLYSNTLAEPLFYINHLP
jgi:hypothetical protein